MKSGWFRLWVVASLVVWIGGVGYMAWNDNADGVPWPNPLPIADSQWYGAECDPSNRAIMTMDQLRQRDPAYWNRMSDFNKSLGVCVQPWSQSVWQARWGKVFEYWSNIGLLPWLLFGPLVLGASILAVGWVRKGFTASTPPPSA